MNHWLILPILIPAVTAPLLMITARFDMLLSRVFCVGANVAQVIVALILVQALSVSGPDTYDLGGWVAPYGIELTADLWTAMFLLLAAVLGVVVSIAAMDGEDERGRYFHALFLFQMMGINGAFLTGDLFNLFVFFEVMLLASYGLMVHGGGTGRLRAGVQFVVINLVGSTLFLIGVSLVYGACGSLNLQDVAARAAAIPLGNQNAMLTGIALMIGVFAVKSAVVPFHVWLPATYREGPPIVTALFSVTSKVGVYAILRLGLALEMWDVESPFHVIAWWMMPLALATSIIGGLGALGSKRLGEMAGYAVIASMGTILIGVAVATREALVAAHYYLLHSTLAGAGLFLIVALVQENRGQARDAIRPAAWKRRSGLIGSGYFCAAVAMVGLPPLSGFIGKILLLSSLSDSPWWLWSWSVVLGTSLLMLVGMTRSGIIVFWSSESTEASPRRGPRGVLTLVAVGCLAAILIAMTISAAAFLQFLDQAIGHLLKLAS
ncbi:MAG TPA: monovalent cation/H+ antiporter subunit D [Pirellulaceae bacterium]|nr:monovalent cation/H+ antiporter subunit D [Pirellulaceae bacterium]